MNLLGSLANLMASQQNEGPAADAAEVKRSDIFVCWIIPIFLEYQRLQRFFYSKLVKSQRLTILTLLVL